MAIIRNITTKQDCSFKKYTRKQGFPKLNRTGWIPVLIST